MRPIEPLLALVLLPLLPGCQPKEVQALLEPSQALGAVLAEESLRLAGANKQVALITHDASWGAPSSAETALRTALKKRGAVVLTAKTANLGNPMLSGDIGLKPGDFFDALQNSAKAGAIISLVGAPLLKDADAARVGSEHPPVLVVATATLGDKRGVHSDAMLLARLLDARVIQLAVIDGADPAPPPGDKADPAYSLFAQNYRFLRRPD